MNNNNPVLYTQNLGVQFKADKGIVHAVKNVHFQVFRGQVWVVVGESGCGKSTLAYALMNLLPPTASLSGHVWFNGYDLLQMDAKKLRDIRGRQIAMIFQDPQTSLNPVLRVDTQLLEVLQVHHLCTSRAMALQQIVDVLQRVGISDPEMRMRSYPHELSGGLKQRVMIAMALLGQPAILIADEPTTALDVTIQAQVLELLRSLKHDQKLQMGIILITHDLGVAADMADQIAVMYAGQIVEIGPAEAVFHTPSHPYTQALLRANPILGKNLSCSEVINGQPPDLRFLVTGCAFAPRCKYTQKECLTLSNELENITPTHSVRCRRHGCLNDKEASI